ncbi:BlaI/MecI/CopY family transcriptional regulator [Nocardia cyriacigeorgica]|uniref:BlaI/MecI/CopY family transcriptional regulator n=1 Tax=Nocardia cyriacigeorgica TaxID=135487 RepID=UPI0018960704|nr:BlaI/MecI/CopY family transcriptional regulator [Nocardia cyriacigeorgica]MBF6102374.1 BlaI/MecI/CopY family transcriptional regulator [Nocardia cyriacigeorgica]MBF6163133.1 BlaI/MecI/CopY family transcriptional regulator [Nocardia cyriacigeorgica]MBF6202101.1 BlaI/MecI/CopY family transcriptional regulator [Nocardia cyriacigeorgica]MBF6318459.1 BlaI/MecI/CopY family transcriptional regulator [Nocardia cyriacigeorgica]MBF6518609.1 BlaI/MecI/CopY family transcriptional regulator [Nocardia cy
MAHRFGDLESVVMDRIWSADDTTTVREVFEDLLQIREIAYTTVMTTMDNLHRKGWLERERRGRAYVYWPSLTREQYSAKLMRDALGGGRSDLILAHFVEQISDDESTALRTVLRGVAARRRKKE